MLLSLVQTINAYLSDYVLVFLLLLVGLWYSIKTRFVQIRCFGEGMRSVFGNLSLNGKKHEKGMSSFQALATAIAAQVGTGNIVGNIFVAVCLLFFAFSTVLSWNMFGRINVIYLFGHKAVIAYQLISLVFIFLGTMASNDLVWELSDMFNQLMVIPNSIALFALTGMVLHGAHSKSE